MDEPTGGGGRTTSPSRSKRCSACRPLRTGPRAADPAAVRRRLAAWGQAVWAPAVIDFRRYLTAQGIDRLAVAARRVATCHASPHTSGASRSRGEGSGWVVGKELSRRAILALGVTSLAYGVIGCGGQRGSARLGPLLAHSPAPARRRPVFVVHELLPQAPPDAVALTIDDGPHPEWTPRVLDLLAREHVRATFSVVGVRARAFPTLVRRIVEEGHGVCNHTLTHPEPFPRRRAEEIERQVAEAQAAIADAGGVSPHLFRSPGGGWSPVVFDTAARHGLVPIDWDVDPRDWARPGAVVITRRLLRAKPGDILLCHDGGGNRAQTYTALTRVLPELKSRGLTFVAL